MSKLTNKPCYCEACKIENRKKPNEVTDIVDGMGMCKEHAKIYKRIIPEILPKEEEDEWN